MARIGNETSLVLKLATANVELQKPVLNQKIKAHFAHSNMTTGEALEIGIREGIKLYQDTLDDIVRKQEDR